MDANTEYEIKARAFHIMTGHMAPGKDAPSASYPAPYEERYILWEYWLESNNDCIRAMLKAFEDIVI